MISTRGSAGQATGQASQVTQVSSFKESMQLNDPSFLDIVPEPWWRLDDQMPTAVMMESSENTRSRIIICTITDEKDAGALASC